MKRPSILGGLFFIFEVMKKYLVFLFCISNLFSCSNSPKANEISIEEKVEMKKIESFKKTDKENEDSVMAHWEKKMNDSKLGEE